MEEIRGVWIPNRPHSQVLASRQNIAEAMNFLQQKGFNSVFPVVWNRGYTLFLSQVMGEYNLPSIEPFYAQQNRDPLAEVVIEAHKRNIAVIPWFEYGFAASHLPDGGHILQQKSSWTAIDKDGARVKHGGLVWMNGLNPEVQQFMLKLIIEVVKKYDVEGIQGCDRLPALPVAGGYDRETSQRFQAQFGKKPPVNPQNRQWRQWRADLLTNFLARLYQQVKAIKPKAIVSLSPAVYPFCLDNLLQDSKVWIERGLIDVIHPQIYRPDFSSYCREVNRIKKTINADFLNKFAPAIALTANNRDMSIDDLKKCVDLNRQTGFSGQIFFHYEGLRKHNDAVANALYQFFKIV
ncbi:family 10 glycosylhydrolase [Pleurocapsales cyanobacterium LEGE 06147]|nr:family 10 glycosylhydrolase [Pleurocapsales cyanobacterium LEGE 06147]